MENENLVQFPRTNAAVAAIREVYGPGVLPFTEEVRNVALSASERESIETLGLRLGEIGAQGYALLLLGLAARWKAAA